jgi:hypothetical protein
VDALIASFILNPKTKKLKNPRLTLYQRKKVFFFLCLEIGVPPMEF